MPQENNHRGSLYQRLDESDREHPDDLSGTERTARTSGKRQPLAARRQKTRKYRIRRRALRSRLVLALLVVLAVFVSLVAADYRANAGTIHRGVEASGIPLGGKSPEEARTVLENRFAGTPREIRLEGTRDAAIPANSIGLGLDVASTVDKAYSVGRQGGLMQRLVERMRGAVGTISVEPQAKYDSELARAEVERVASEMNQDPRNASVSVAGGEVAVGESGPGYRVDVAATTENVRRAAQSLEGEAEIAGENLEPAVGDAVAEEAAQRARAALEEPLVLEAGGESWRVSAEGVGEALSITRDEGALRVGLDRDTLRQRLPGMYESLNSAPAEADYAFEGGEVTVQAGQAGRRVVSDRLFSGIEQGVFEGRHRYEVPLTRIEPELKTAEARRLKPTEMIGRYRTTYVGTGDESEARTENLRTAANAIDGATLAPGETFSANEILADLDYNDANVIIDGKVESALGGGLCQIASTVYMAVNYAGLDVTERHPHHSELSYIRPGLDSTLWFGAENGYTGQELDMEFRNTSGGYVMVREYVDEDGYLYAEVWGQPTGKEVEMDSRQVSSSEEQTEWVTTQTTERGGETLFDGVLHRDTYEPLISEEGEPIPNADPAPVRQ